MKRHSTALTLLLALGSLSACAGLSDPAGNGDGPQTAAATAQPAATTQSAPARLSNLSEEAARERQEERRRLIEDINNDGRTPSLRYQSDLPAPVAPPENDTVELNYEQAELREVLAQMADALDISLVIDPSIDARISIRTAPNRPLSYGDVWPLMRVLSQQSGVVLERIGNVYHARRSDALLPDNITMAGDDAVAGSAMQITPLRHIAVPAAIDLLEPMLEPEGRMMRLGSGNTLAIIANESQLARINELLQLIDDDPFRSQGIRIFELTNAGAGAVAEELNEILNMIEGDAPAFQVQALERINALLITAPAQRGFEEISRWVRLLDDADQEQGEQLFRYRVKNLIATDLAATLTDVFRQDERNGETRRTDEQARTEQQLREQARIIRAEEGEPIEAQADSAPMTVSQIVVSADLRVSIVADDATNSLLIRGTPRDYRQLLETINQLDAVPLQVMINAAIAQITLTDDTAFGVDWSRVVENLGSGSATVSTSFLPAGGESGSGLGGLLFNRSFLDGAARIDATLEAIATNNEVRLLARPSLTVVNNMEGQIQIGAQVPVRLGETATQIGTTTNIQYRDTGIVLYITPRINDDGVVNLTISQSLSSLSEGSGVDDNPIFQNQEIETTVVVRDGENVVLGGLIQDNNDRLNTGVPFLNRIPVLGGLFSYQRDNNERQELFIVLRPEIINLNESGNDRYRVMRDRFERAAAMLEGTEFE